MDLFGDLPEPTTNQLITEKVCFVEKFNENKVDKRKISTKENNDKDEPIVKKNQKEIYELKGFCAERKGERDDMQDAHVLIYKLDPNISDTRISFFGVYDGHGGTKASKYASENLHKIIAQLYPKVADNFEKNIRKCLIESFKKVDEDFLNEARKNKPTWKDGTTAVTVLAVDNTLYISNLGDSKAILCRYNETKRKLQPIPLSVDHSPTLYEERMRIQKAGGHVREGRVMGILEVSRSIGDGSFKQHGVTCIPDVKKCQLTNNDRFILIACDGLWKSFKDDSAISFIEDILKNEKLEIPEGRDSNNFHMEFACNQIANEAVRRLSADNVTVMILAINKPIKL